MKSEWMVLSGGVGTMQGGMTLIDTSDMLTGVAVVGDSAWDNYAIEFDVSGLYDDETERKLVNYSGGEGDGFVSINRIYGKSIVALLLNVQPRAMKIKDASKAEGFIIGYSYVGWGVVDLQHKLLDWGGANAFGYWLSVPAPGLYDASNMSRDTRHFRVEKRGRQYSAFYDGKSIGSYEARYESGLCGLWFGKLNRWPDSDSRAVPVVRNFVVMPLSDATD